MSWMSNEGYSGTEIRNLYANLNKGLPAARTTFMDAAHSYIKTFNQGDKAFTSRHSFDEIRQDYEANKSIFESKIKQHKIIDTTGHDDAVKKMSNKHQSLDNFNHNIDNSILRNKDSLIKKGNQLKESVIEKL